MTAECRPPPGTPDGTVCWLLMPEHGGLPVTYHAHLWRQKYPSGLDWWERFGSDAPWSPRQMARWGYRFHSIAEPPADA